MQIRDLRFAIASALVVPTLIFAQQFRSSITGRVSDQQGAVIPGVNVRAVNLNTGTQHETFTTASGQYSLPFLEPGEYEVAAETDGFKRYVRSRVVVRSNEPVDLDISMELGQIVETITVDAAAPILNMSNASSGQVIATDQLANLPMNGRTPLSLAQIGFGVVPNSDPRFTRPFDNAGPSGFSMGGAPGRSNELLLDGAPDTTRNKRVAYNPPVDAVAEVKVEAFQVDAAYGNTGGGTVNVVLKSGTNEFHGSVYEFNQVAKLAATDFFVNRRGDRKSNLVFNQWGVTAGGPFMIPKVLDGRNKLFWFFAYEGIKNSTPEPVFTTVPTDAQRVGDFSALRALGENFTIFDPMTAVPTGDGRVSRTPFPNNQIPANRQNSISQNFLDFVPGPNTAGRADGKDNFLANTARTDDFWSGSGKLDYNASDRHRMAWSFRRNIRTEFRGNRFDNISTGNFLRRVNWGSTLDDVYTINPTTLLNTRFNWTRFTEGSKRPSAGFDPTTLGFPQSLAAASSQLVMPEIVFRDFQTLGTSGSLPLPFDQFQTFVSLTKIVGAHTVKFGTDLRLFRENRANFGSSAGRFEFREDFVRGPFNNSPRAPLGQDLASFMLGIPTAGRFEVAAFRSTQSKYAAFFLQDDWRASSTLSINLGIRYEKEFALTERFNRQVVGFDPDAQLELTSAARAAFAANPIPELSVDQFNPTGGLRFASPDDRNAFGTGSSAISPRIGFAWTPTALGGNTVIRTGFGLFYFTSGLLTPEQPGFLQRTPLVASLDGGLTPNVTLDNPFPDGIQSPIGGSRGVNTFLGQDVAFFNPRQKNPYSARWSFNIQHSLRRDLVWEIGYMGNSAVKMPLERSGSASINPIPRELLSMSASRDQATIDQLTRSVANPFAGLAPGTDLNGGSVVVSQLLRPFPQFIGDNGVRMREDNFGSSYFHMFQTRLEKRFSDGAQFSLNYQYSRLMERRSFLNPTDTEPENRVAAEDRPHRVVLSGVYELPFGRGKPIAGNSGRALDALIGGWMINGIYTYQSGSPINFGNVIFLGGDLQIDSDNVERAFDVTRFNRDPQQQLDFNVRTFPTRFNNIRDTPTNNVDFSVIKNFALFEQVKLQFRAEFFNFLNHPTFSGLNVTPTSSNFGFFNSQRNLPRLTQLGLRVTW